MKLTSISDPALGCIRLSAWFGLAGLLIAALAWLAASRVPKDSPLAQMYRTEADLRALVTAIEMYARDLGAYPPAGIDGLRAATGHLSRDVDYLPEGPPNDAWDRPYVYVPHTEYDRAGSLAFSGPGGPFAPRSFQLYSVGMDGDAGLTNPELSRDNIVNWDPNRSWRAVYKMRQRAHTRNNEGPGPRTSQPMAR